MSKIVTYYGQTVDLLDPDPETILLEDIAHNLSHIVRFNGATRYPYSVAQHSLYVSHLVGPGDALIGLMHDATEAYLGDVVSPLKELLPEYRLIEERMWGAICKALSLDPHFTQGVHDGDVMAYLKERTTLIGTPIVNDPDFEHFKVRLVPEVRIHEYQEPNDVKHEFITRFHVLKGGPSYDQRNRRA